MNQEALFRLAEEAIKLWDVEVESINLHLQSENMLLEFTEKITMIWMS